MNLSVKNESEPSASGPVHLCSFSSFVSLSVIATGNSSIVYCEELKGVWWGGVKLDSRRTEEIAETEQRECSLLGGVRGEHPSCGPGQGTLSDGELYKQPDGGAQQPVLCLVCCVT